MAGPDYILDLRGDRVAPQAQSPGADACRGDERGARPGGAAPGNPEGASGDPSGAQAAKPRPRPWIAVRWRCCGTYSRVYRNRAGDAYEGRCPRCGAVVKARIGPEGTDQRFFEAG